MTKKHPALSRPLKLLTILAITASLTGSLAGVSFADQSPWVSASSEYGRTAAVYFDNLNVLLGSQPINHKGTIMIQAGPFLRSLGYQVTWDASTKKLSATKSGESSLVFWEMRKEAEVDGQLIKNLSAAPFVIEDELWVPLRFTALNCGLSVTWNPHGSFATVRDPHAQIQLRVGTRADNEVTDTPEALIQYMKENWETNIQVNLSPPRNFPEKTKIKIAAGDMDSLMLLPDSFEFQDDLFQSIALDLDQSLKAYPALQQLIDESGMPVRKIDGKTYTIPRPHDLNDAPFPALRQDWLNNLGSKQPVTMDDMFSLLKQFVSKDPDGDGKKNTIGMYAYVQANSLGSLSWVEHAFTGSPDRFTLSKNGEVIDHAITTGQRQALEWLNRAFADGLINKDFATIDRDQLKEEILKGQSGLAILSFDDAAKLTLDNKGTWTPVSGLKATSTAQEIAPWNSAGGGVYIVSSMSRIEPAKVLEWLDQGIQMTESGKWADIKELKQADKSAIQNLFGRKDVLQSNTFLDALAPETKKLYEQAATSWHQTSYAGQTLPEASQLWGRGLYAESISELNEMKIKVIQGEASLQQWDDFVKKQTASEQYKSMIKDLNKLIQTK